MWWINFADTGCWRCSDAHSWRIVLTFSVRRQWIDYLRHRVCLCVMMCSVRLPPRILKSPVNEKIYQLDDDLQLDCVAEGTPQPRYCTVTSTLQGHSYALPRVTVVYQDLWPWSWRRPGGKDEWMVRVVWHLKPAYGGSVVPEIERAWQWEGGT